MKLTSKRGVLLLSCVACGWILTATIHAAEWKFRAREHYEWHDIKLSDRTIPYRGFSNTINFWLEEPFKYAMGASFSPLFGSAKAQESPVDRRLGKTIKLFSVGAEAKVFTFQRELPWFYTRGGLGWSQLRTEGRLGDINGWNVYLGVGGEFLWKNIGIAPEFATRFVRLSDGVDIQSITPSIGFHFYGKVF